MRQIGIAVNDFDAQTTKLPEGVDENNFSALARLLHQNRNEVTLGGHVADWLDEIRQTHRRDAVEQLAPVGQPGVQLRRAQGRERALQRGQAFDL
jgi:hypothetical protein